MEVVDESGSEQQYFVELDECCHLLTIIGREQNNDDKLAALEKLVCTLDKYLEQPLLVAACSIQLADPINTALLDLSIEQSCRMEWLGKAVYAVCRVMGYKHATKHLPHEVDHLNKCLDLLDKSRNQSTAWESTFMLLQWLAALCLIPFDISSMDCGGSGDESLVARVVRCCRVHLSETGPTRDAAAVCLSALLTRPDMEDHYLAEYMSWGVGQLTKWSLSSSKERTALTAQYFGILGVLQTTFRIYKLGHRSKLQSYGDRLLPLCIGLCEATGQVAVRKLLTKIVQRIGMNYLPPRVASWRYMRGTRSLCLGAKSKAISGPLTLGSEQVPVAAGEDGDCGDIPMALEDVIDSLLCSMQDADTVVRWSAAKGIGRIAMRLPKDFASDVVDAVVEAFADREAHCSWHGGCLTLAELARRGLLLPDRLETVMPILAEAIRFDVLRGQHSIGAHVRDAACYVCWAFSRAYSSAVMSPYIVGVTKSLLITALFDREVNCRRAASAAYQETVGRQGDQNVPHGIDILTVADYVAVGNRVNCFTALAAAVADLDSALPATFVQHLAEVTVRHWDKDMRELAAKALARLVKSHGEIVKASLPQLVASCTSTSLNLRHGAVVATGAVVLFLTSEGILLEEEVLSAVIGIPAAVDSARLYRCRGSEILREAIAKLIRDCARSKFSVSVKLQVALVDSLYENLRQPHDSVQESSSRALREFLHAHFLQGGEPSERLQKLTSLRFLEGLAAESNVSVTRGCALAIGALPVRLIALPVGRAEQILNALAKACSPEHTVNGEHDADTSCKAVSALVTVVEKLCDAGEITVAMAELCLNVLVTSCNDYTVDNRGDTGSWSRVAALKGLETILYALLRAVQRVRTCPVGENIESSLGVGVEVSRQEKKEVSVVELRHPAQSTAWHALGGLTERVILRGPAVRWRSVNDQVGADDVLEVARRLLQALTEAVLKQLAEKLDAVREVAGSVLIRLLEVFPPPAECANCDVSIVDWGLLMASMNHDSAPAAADLQLFQNLRREINWANPAHPFPIVCAMLRSRTHFAAILSGLVVSVGGLSDSASKLSLNSLLVRCADMQASEPEWLARLGEALVDLLNRNHRNDRVIVPTLKTFLRLLEQGSLDCVYEDKRSTLAMELHKALQAEVKGSTNLSKVRIALELHVRLLSFGGHSSRSCGLLTVLPLLTHKYPLVRKYCAEQLYLHLLACPTRAEEENAQLSIDRAVQQLSSTSWEAGSKTELVTARAMVTRSLGFEGAADELIAGLNSQPAQARATKKECADTDELASYEALVRDAGY